MQQLPLEIVQTLDIRPFPLVQDTTTRDEDITYILHNLLRINILHLHMPLAALLIPPRPQTPLPKLHIPSHPILLRNSLPIPQNFWRPDIERRPIRVRLKRQLVAMRWDVARTPRIAVLVPCSAHVGVLVVDGELEIGHVLGQVDGGTDARNAGADVYHFEGTGFVEGTLRDEGVSELAGGDFVAH